MIKKAPSKRSLINKLSGTRKHKNKKAYKITTIKKATMKKMGTYRVTRK